MTTLLWRDHHQVVHYVANLDEEYISACAQQFTSWQGALCEGSANCRDCITVRTRPSLGSRIVERVARGATTVSACATEGVSVSSWKAMRKQDPDLDAAYREAAGRTLFADIAHSPA